MMNSPSRRLRPAATLTLLGLLLVCSGCAQLELDTYSSYEDWMVARQDPFDIESFGVETEKYGAVDYLLNDCVIRTPIFAVYDASRCVLSAFTLPYYALGGGKESDPTTTVADLPTGLE